jgi:hypothetical protein
MLTENLTTSVAAGRPTISVVIDEDEDTQEEIELQSGDRIHGVLMSNGSQTVERHSKESANFVCRFIIHTIFADCGPPFTNFSPFFCGLISLPKLIQNLNTKTYSCSARRVLSLNTNYENFSSSFKNSKNFKVGKTFQNLCYGIELGELNTNMFLYLCFGSVLAKI